MVFACAPNFRAKAAAKKQALKQKLAGAGAYHGVSLRLLLVDKQVDEQDVLPHAALGCVHVIKYDAKGTTLAELVGLIREAHRQNGAPFLSMAIAQHGADGEGQWAWTTDLTVNLNTMHGAIDQLAPVIEVLAAALSKTKAGKAHIDLLACNLATSCKGLVPALEKMYGIDFRASTDETGNDLSGGDWKMETDNDYDVAADYLDADKLKAYTETMDLGDKMARAKQKVARAKQQVSKATGKGRTGDEGFNQLVDEDDHVRYNKDPADNEQLKGKVIRKAKAKAKKGVMAGVGMGLGELVPGLGAAIKIPAIKCTMTHLANLKKIRGDTNISTRCGCNPYDIDGCVTCAHIIEFVIAQKQGKLNNNKIGMVPVVGTLNTVRRTTGAVVKKVKGTKGEVRLFYAGHLHKCCHNDCPMATAIATELLGGYTNKAAVDALRALMADKKKCLAIFQDKMASA